MKIFALIKRRPRQGIWLYVCLALVYSFMALWYAEEAGFHSGIQVHQLWPLLVPLFIIATHIAYPTVLTWVLIFFPFAAYSSVGLYYLIRNAFGAQWEYDLSGFILGIIVIIFFACICYGLYRYRPFKSSTPRRGGSALPIAAPDSGTAPLT